MILFLLLLILAAIGVGIYANENTATHSVNFLQWHWSAVPDWLPVVATAVVIGALFLLYMIYSGLVHGVRLGSMRRRVSTREQAINDMRAENQRLREENARMRAGQRTAATTPNATYNPNLQREPVGSTTDTATRTNQATVDRSAAPAYQPRPTFGERVRAFFSGRQPAGY